MKLAEIVSASAAIGGTRSRKAKTELIASCLRGLRAEEVPIAVAYPRGRLPQGTVGVGWASLRRRPPPASEPTLELLEVDNAFERIRSAAGTGSQEVRRTELAAMFERATEPEQTFLAGLRWASSGRARSREAWWKGSPRRREFPPRGFGGR